MRTLYIVWLAGLVQYRVAFLALGALVVGAAIPLAYAWARVLPEDAPTFKVEPGSFPSVELEPRTASAKAGKADWISIALLLCVTLTYLIRFPGVPLATLIQWFSVTFSGTTVNWIVLGTKIVLVVGTGLAACLATLRPGPMRVPLVVAAAMALILWLLGPILQSAMLGS